MRAEVSQIFPNTIDLEWDGVESALDPRDDWHWISVDIGPDDDGGADYFQALVATDRALGRAKRICRTDRVITVESLSESDVTKAISDIVMNIEGEAWQQIVDQLLPYMSWEYEGMER